MVIRVEHGKGGKDRMVMLSPQLLGICGPIGDWHARSDWLFPGRGDKPIDVQVLHAACRSRDQGGGSGQAGERAYAAPQFRDPPA